MIPGTGAIYTISTGLTKGKKVGIIAALGCTIGIIPHIIVGIFLSSFLLSLNEKAFFILKIIGGIYLFYLGLQMLVSKTTLTLDNHSEDTKTKNILFKAVFINLLNPKLTIFFFSFLPQYIHSDSSSYICSNLILGSLFMLLTFLVFSAYAILSGLSASLIGQFPKRILHIQQIFGIVFIAFAAKLIFSTM